MNICSIHWNCFCVLVPFVSQIGSLILTPWAFTSHDINDLVMTFLYIRIKIIKGVKRRNNNSIIWKTNCGLISLFLFFCHCCAHFSPEGHDVRMLDWLHPPLWLVTLVTLLFAKLLFSLSVHFWRVFSWDIYFLLLLL